MTAGGDKHLPSPEVVVVEEEGKEVEEDYYGAPKLLLDIRRTPSICCRFSSDQRTFKLV